MTFMTKSEHRKLICRKRLGEKKRERERNTKTGREVGDRENLEGVAEKERVVHAWANSAQGAGFNDNYVIKK